MKTTTATGVLFGGEGKASRFVEISWVKNQIEERFGFKPYPGTLNLRFLGKEAIRVKRALARCKRIEIAPSRGFFAASCFRVMIMSRVEGAIIMPEKPGYPSDVLEIIAPVHLRNVLSIKDGDPVELSITITENVKG